MATLADLRDNHDVAHLEAALRYVTEWRCAVDGGAHRGIWTRRMAERFGHVAAFEPVAANGRRIPRLPNVLVQPYALYREACRVVLAAGPANTGQWHIAAEGDSALAVPLDGFGLDGVGFLKLDVEGVEAHALMGARETIRRCRPVVMIEENGLCARYGVRRDASGRLLRRWGYVLVQRCNKDEIYIPKMDAP